MKKKMAAIAITATMLLSLVGCGKKNFDGEYSGSIECTDALAEVLNQEMASSYDSIDYDWKGSFSLTFNLELEDGEYTLSTDSDAVEEELKEFFGENVEDLMYVIVEEMLSSYYDLDGMSVDDIIEEGGYSSIWEAAGYESKDEFVDYLISEIDTSEFEEKYSGDYEIDGDSITLEDVDGEDWVLDYEDGDLTGELDLSDLGMDDDVKITFERVEEE